MRNCFLIAIVGLLASSSAWAAPKVEEVTVEGVGKTVEDALKDAMRAAIRQVAGAVVVEEQKLANDKVVQDTVLTASSTYVSGYERLKLKEEGGLFRVTIKAKVEKAELIDKLRTLKFTIKEVDAKRILREPRFSDEQFAKMSKEEMIRDKTEIINDALVDLHKVLDATSKTLNRFNFNAATGTMSIDVDVKVDNARYVQFLKRLQLRLDKLCLGKVSGTADAKPKDLPWPAKVPGFQTEECTFAEGPDLRRNPEAWCLWVMTAAGNNGTGTRWLGYILDTDPRQTLEGLAGELKVQVAVRDAEGKSIVDDSIDLTKSAWLGVYLPRSKQYVHLDGIYEHQAKMLTANLAKLEITQERTVNAMIAPMEMQFNWAHVNKIARGSPQFAYCLTRTYPIQVKIDKEEVKRIKDVRCDVQFRPEK